MGNRILEMELNKAREIERKSQLLNLNTRREYIEKQERMRQLNKKAEEYRKNIRFRGGLL